MTDKDILEKLIEQYNLYIGLSKEYSKRERYYESDTYDCMADGIREFFNTIGYGVMEIANGEYVLYKLKDMTEVEEEK